MAKRSTKAPRTTKARPRQDEFYQYLPGAYIDSYEMFPADDEAERTKDASVRRRMVLQLVVLVALLIAQFVLFAVLLQSTVNLG